MTTKQNANPARLGSVTSIYTEQGSVLVDVTMAKPGTAYRKIPFMQLAPGLVVTPAVGENVVVVRLEDGSHIAMFPQGTPADVTMPVLGERELCFKFDDATELRVQQSDSGSGYEVSLTGSADVNVEAAGEAAVTAGESVRVIAGGDATVAADGNLAVSGENVSVDASGTATVRAARVQLGGGDGSPVARVGDAVRVFAPEHGWISGQISSGSQKTTAE